MGSGASSSTDAFDREMIESIAGSVAAASDAELRKACAKLPADVRARLSTALVDNPYPFGLCAFDLDGTLCAPDGTVRPRVFEAVRAARAKGAAIVLATGRPAPFAADLPKLIDGNADFLICSNGSAMYNVAGKTDPADFTLAVPPAQMGNAAVREIGAAILAAIPEAEFLVSMQVSPVTPMNEMGACCSERVIDTLFTQMGKRHVAGMKRGMKTAMHHPATAFRDSGSYEGIVVAFEGLDQEQAVAKVAPVLAAATNEEAKGWRVNPAGLPHGAEIKPKTAGKELMLQQLLATLGMDAADCMAFGDGLNDLGMLKWAGLGVAMGNAEAQAVTDSADISTDTNDNDGVAIILEDMLATATSVRQYAAVKRGSTAGD